jgi:hypothetical protein
MKGCQLLLWLRHLPDHVLMVRSLRLVFLAIVPIVLLEAGAAPNDKPDERLKSVTAIFDNTSHPPLRERVDRKIRSGKTCFSLAPAPSGADAILEIVLDLGEMEAETGTGGATATLTLQSGEEVWSRSERVILQGDFLSDLVNRLLNRLAADAGCKARTKAK